MAEVVPGQRHDRSALILFGSETGNSEEVAECLGQVVERLHFTSQVCEMNDVDLNFLSQDTVVIFVISTTGQGEFPKNARKFWKSLLRKRLPPNCLSHVSFTCFGLGDSSYVQFNWAVRKLHKRLGQLGAQEIYPRGEGDEQHNEGIDGTYLSWSADFGKRLLSLYPLPEGVVPIPPHVFLPLKYYIELAEESKERKKIDEELDSSAQPEIKNSDLVRDLLVVGTSTARTGEARDKTKSGSFLEQVTTTQPHQSLLTATKSTPLGATTLNSTSTPFAISTTQSANTDLSNAPEPTDPSSLPTIDLVAKPSLHGTHPPNATEPATSAHLSPTTVQPKANEPTAKMGKVSDWLDRSDPAFPPPCVKGYIVWPHVDPIDDPLPCDQLKEYAPGQSEYGSIVVPMEDKDKRPVKDHVPFPGCDSGIVLSNSRMTPIEHWQDVRQLTLAVPEDFDPTPGDVLVLYPRNSPEDVDKLIGLMGWEDIADKVVTFIPGRGGVPKQKKLYPVKDSTVRDLLTYNFDITAVPGRRFLEFMRQYCSNQMHCARLDELANPASCDEFFDYTSRPRRTIIEVLADFPSVEIDWRTFVSIFPLLRPRKYSICNGGTQKKIPGGQHKGLVKVQILVAIVKYRTVLRKIRKGLCSNYISQLPVGYKVDVGIEPSEFGPDIYHPCKPVILIGPGTGIAPLRSIIWERAVAELKDESKRKETVLFYGGRNRKADYFYGNEWYTLRDYVTVYAAFSRDQEKKIYVQDIIRREGKKVWEMMTEGANIIVCGSSGVMPQAVKTAIIDAIEEWGGFKDRLGFPDREAAREAYKAWEMKGGRYVEDVW